MLAHASISLLHRHFAYCHHATTWCRPLPPVTASQGTACRDIHERHRYMLIKLSLARVLGYATPRPEVLQRNTDEQLQHDEQQHKLHINTPTRPHN